MSSTVLCNIENNVATITLNRPDAMNSFNRDMATDLKKVTEQVAADTSVRAVLLNGAGHQFMAGGDLNFFHQQMDQMPKGVHELVNLLNDSIRNLMQMPKPVLAVVHGSVAGAGVSIMLAADLVLAEENTVFTTAYSAIGISMDGGASYHLPRTVGTKRAMELSLLSERFDATTARQYGLINWTAALDELPQRTASIINKLANGPSVAYAEIKRLINQSNERSLEQQFEAEAVAFAHCSQSHDFGEGVAAFLEKRRPKFTGG